MTLVSSSFTTVYYIITAAVEIGTFKSLTISTEVSVYFL